MPEQSYRYRPILISICLIASIIAVYWPVYRYEFVRYDDNSYVTDNVNIKSGLNWKSISWAFTTDYASNWHPVTWLSHTLDCQLFGRWAGGHHITNVLFHILNTLLLFYVFMQMTGALWPSAFVAAAFALHPLHVESVAWIAERKDVLSTFFWLLTMWTYVRYVRNPKLKWYLAAIILFVLGLMSKPMLVTLPFVLLLLDYWPLERKISHKLLIEKIPFFICSIASCVVTFIIQRSQGVTAAVEALGFKTRANNTIVSYVAYIAKMIWPSRLAMFYMHPGDGLPITKVIACGLLLVLISIYFICLSRRYRFLAVGWFWYLGTLVPVIGLVQVGSQAMADRYTYMTLTGLFVIIAWSAKEFFSKWHHRNIILAWLSIIVLTASTLTAWQQRRYWENSVTLFGHTLQVTENNYNILGNYANALARAGRFDEAIERFNEFLKIEPNSADAHYNFGFVLLWTGKTQEAIEHFKLAIKYQPDYPQTYYNLADIFEKQGRNEDAVSYYKQALKIKPDYIDARLKLAMIFNEMKKFDQAVESFNKVLELEPNNIAANGNLGIALAALGKTDEAIEKIRFVLNARPEDVEMHRNLGILLENKGDVAGAIKSYRTALQINPNDVNTRQLLEAALKKQTTP